MNMNEIVENAQPIAALGGLVVSLIGFIFVAYQIWQIQKSLRTSSLAALNQQLHEIRTILVEYPELRAYFCDGKPCEPNAPDYARVVTIAEMYLNHLEHFAVNHKVFRREDGKAWGNYVSHMLESSPVMRSIVNARPYLYSPDFLRFMKPGEA